MLAFEWLSFVYMAVFGLLAAVTTHARRRGAAFMLSAVGVALVLVAAHMPDAVRLVLPNIYLILGYWIPALLLEELPENAEDKLQGKEGDPAAKPGPRSAPDPAPLPNPHARPRTRL